jgi:Calx-beta domain
MMNERPPALQYAKLSLVGALLCLGCLAFGASQAIALSVVRIDTSLGFLLVQAAKPGGQAASAAAPATSAPQQAPAGRAAPARERMAARAPEGGARSPAPGSGEEASRAADERWSPRAGERQSAATREEQTLAAGEGRSPGAGEEQSPGAGTPQKLAAVEEKQSPITGEKGTLPIDEEQSPAVGAEQGVAAVGENQSPTTGEQESLAVKASVDPAEPGADQIVFRIELSRPAGQTVVLIYGTIEGTAKAGEDFEPQQGVMTLAPGTTNAEVHVPLVEHPSSIGEKRFELFLTADPKVAEVVDQRIMATIDGERRDAQPEPDAPIAEQSSKGAHRRPRHCGPRLTRRRTKRPRHCCWCRAKPWTG